MNGKLTGKRKFIVAMTALMMTFILALADKVEGGEWAITVSAIVGLFGVANALKSRNGGGNNGTGY